MQPTDAQQHEHDSADDGDGTSIVDESEAKEGGAEIDDLKMRLSWRSGNEHNR